MVDDPPFHHLEPLAQLDQVPTEFAHTQLRNDIVEHLWDMRENVRGLILEQSSIAIYLFEFLNE